MTRHIPDRFKDDGCTRSPDGMFGFDFRWACRRHDWRYCTRCHSPGLTLEHQKFADKELRDNIKSALPWRWGWVAWVYYAAVWRYGGFNAFNSCGRSAGDLCRHNMPLPDWMKLGPTRRIA